MRESYGNGHWWFSYCFSITSLKSPDILWWFRLKLNLISRLSLTEYIYTHSRQMLQNGEFILNENADIFNRNRHWGSEDKTYTSWFDFDIWLWGLYAIELILSAQWYLRSWTNDVIPQLRVTTHLTRVNGVNQMEWHDVIANCDLSYSNCTEHTRTRITKYHSNS